MPEILRRIIERILWVINTGKLSGAASELQGVYLAAGTAEALVLLRQLENRLAVPWGVIQRSHLVANFRYFPPHLSRKLGSLKLCFNSENILNIFLLESVDGNSLGLSSVKDLSWGVSSCSFLWSPVPVQNCHFSAVSLEWRFLVVFS